MLLQDSALSEMIQQFWHLGNGFCDRRYAATWHCWVNAFNLILKHIMCTGSREKSVSMTSFSVNWVAFVRKTVRIFCWQNNFLSHLQRVTHFLNCEINFDRYLTNSLLFCNRQRLRCKQVSDWRWGLRTVLSFKSMNWGLLKTLKFREPNRGEVWEGSC